MSDIIGSGCVFYFDYANTCMVLDFIKVALMLSFVCFSTIRRPRQDSFRVFKTLIRNLLKLTPTYRF